MNFTTKQLLLLFIGAIVALVTLTGIGFYRMHLLSDASLLSQKKSLLDDYDALIKSQVQTAVSILANIEARSVTGELTVDEAKKLGADLVRQLRFQKDGYFWIDTIDGTNIALLGKPSEGKNRIDLQDKNGTYIIREIIKQGRTEGGGYTDYWFPKAGSDIPLPKRSYSLEFKPWGWVVGTGNYIDDIDAVIAERKAASHREFMSNISFFAASTVIIILIFIGAGFLIYSMMKNKNREIENADEKIADLNNRFSLAADSAKIGVWDFSITENRLVWDKRMFDLYGVAESDSSNAFKVWRKGVHPDDMVRGNLAIAQALRGEKDFAGEFRVVWPNGEIRHLKVAALVLRDAEGTPLRMIGVNYDITDQKRTHEDLAAARDKAEAATLAKSQFLATMSHEIRTPMNGVIGMSNLLLETNLTDEQRGYAEIVNKSGENLLGLINDILDFSKIEAGKLDIELLDFDIRTTVEDTAEMLAIRAAQAGLELICLIDPAIPEYLRGDPGRLRQIIINLAGNSIKFTHQGEIVISVALLSDEHDFCVIRFEIRDTGIGIPENRRAALFTPFTQVDGSTTRKYGGTGLGLAICKQLTELMGGEIGIESEEGKGSTFWFTARFEKLTEVSKVPEVLADITGTRILVVDDNAANRMLMTTLLKHWDCRFDTAVDGVAALALLHKAIDDKDPFRVALLDQEMPGMDGSELGRRIKADAALEQTLLIMVTSLAQRGDVVALQQIGFAGYLPKPVRQKQLRECIALVLGRGNTPSKNIVTQYTVAKGELPTSTSLHNTRILLAEDNIINQKVAQSILGKLGYKADVVANGLEAVRALEMIDYDVVFMDCMMPEMDGYEATAMIRNPASKVQNHSVPIIAMTANAMKGEREICIEAGMNDYLSKPIKKDDVAAMLEKWNKKSLFGES